MRAVNLLPPERRGRTRQESLAAAVATRPLVVAAAAALALAAGAVAFLNHSASSRVSAKQEQLQQLEATLARTPKQKPQDAGASAAAAAARLGAVETAAAPRTTWDGLLWAVSRVIPEDIWLDSLSMASPTGGTAPAAAGAPATPSAPAGFVISGYTYSHPSVARLMRRLALVPWLTGVSLVSSERSELERRTVYKFSVGASIRSAGVQS